MVYRGDTFVNEAGIEQSNIKYTALTFPVYVCVCVCGGGGENPFIDRSNQASSLLKILQVILTVYLGITLFYIRHKLLQHLGPVKKFI